jgi:hypothetical protein
MTTIDFITELLCRVDEQMRGVRKHTQAVLWPSEVVTLGLLHALKGVDNRAFYRWLTRDYQALFPHLPERTRLFRLLKTHQAWTSQFLAQPILLGIVDSFGIELIHPIREGRSPRQIGRKGISNHRQIDSGLFAAPIHSQQLRGTKPCKRCAMRQAGGCSQKRSFFGDCGHLPRAHVVEPFAVSQNRLLKPRLRKAMMEMSFKK